MYGRKIVDLIQYFRFQKIFTGHETSKKGLPDDKISHNITYFKYAPITSTDI